MDDATDRAEGLYGQGVSLYEISLFQSGSEQEKTQKRCVSLFQDALKTGLDQSTDIQCRLALGVVLFDVYGTQYSDVSHSGLANLRGLSEAVSTLENALALDAQRGTKVFLDRIPQSIAILRLNAIWQPQSVYLKNQFGPERKVSYLKEKLELLEYLGGVKPPNVCVSLAFHYRDDAHDRALTLEWLKSAAAADDYADIDGESWFYKIAEHGKQSGKKGVAEMSTPKRISSTPVKKESSGGCFVATATYGTALAPEVMAFRHFRDDVLLHSKLGAACVRFYYAVSPPIAALVARHRLIRALIRWLLLEPVLRLIKR